MSLETALVNRTGIVVAKLLVFPKFRIREKLVLMSKDFFVSSAEVAVIR